MLKLCITRQVVDERDGLILGARVRLIKRSQSILGFDELPLLQGVLWLIFHRLPNLLKRLVVLYLHNLALINIDDARASCLEGRALSRSVERAELVDCLIEGFPEDTYHRRERRVQIINQYRREAADEEAVPLQADLVEDKVSQAEHDSGYEVSPHGDKDDLSLKQHAAYDLEQL